MASIPIKKLKLAALLVLAGLGIATESAQAQTQAPLPFAAGDIFLGFRSSNASITQDYVVDIGQAVYTDAPGTTITIANFSTDLTNIFGSTWFTSGKTKWGAIADDRPSDPSNTLYVGHLENPFGTFPVNPGSSYAPDTSNNQQGYASNVNLMEGQWSTTDTNTGNVPGFQAAIQNNSDTGSWESEMTTAGGAFSEYTGFESTITSVVSGNNGQAIDLFKIVPTDEGGTSAVYQGRFVIASTGIVTYTAAGSVPEPSTLAALALGSGLLGLVRHRRGGHRLIRG